MSIAIFLFLVTAFLLDKLGDAPIRALQLWSGRIACFFLLASLTITPLRLLTGISIIIPLRKTFGLNAFYYALLHLLVFLILNYRLHWAAIAEAFTQLNFILPGAIAFFILLVLAVTTINPVKRAVKKIWRKIHCGFIRRTCWSCCTTPGLPMEAFRHRGNPKCCPSCWQVTLPCFLFCACKK